MSVPRRPQAAACGALREGQSRALAPWLRPVGAELPSGRRKDGLCVYTRMCMCVTLTRVLVGAPQDLGPDPTPSRLVCQQVHESLSCGEKARLCPTCPSGLSRAVGCRGRGAVLCSAEGAGVPRSMSQGSGCREGCLDRPCLRLGRRAGQWGREREWGRQTSTPERVITQGPDEDGTLEVLV